MKREGIWRQRASTLRAMAYLALARAAVRLLPLRLYRQSLGAMSQGKRAGAASRRDPMPTVMQKRLARRVVRAAIRLPGKSRCLAQAIALHWMLRRIGEEGELVVAIHRTERSRKHSYHAWLEAGGMMLVGACDREDYQELMRFTFNERTEREPSLRAT